MSSARFVFVKKGGPKSNIYKASTTATIYSNGSAMSKIGTLSSPLLIAIVLI